METDVANRLNQCQQIAVKSVAELHAWLRDHHGGRESVWLVTARKSAASVAGGTYLPYAAIVEEVLCWGWVDSLPRALDAERTMLLLSPRKAGSAWSAPNRARAEALIAAGRMQPAGQRVVDAARADSSWDFLKDAEAGVEPPDLAAALDADPQARAGFAGFTPATRRRILEFLKRAVRAETRAKRIAQIISGARAGKDPLAWTPAAQKKGRSEDQP